MNRFYENSIPVQVGFAELSLDNARIARQVLRVRENEPVELVDGRGGLAAGVIEQVQKTKVVVRITSVQKLERSKPNLTLLQAFPKGDRPEFIIQKAVEWGLGQVVFVVSDHTVPQKKNINRERWERIAVEALRQSGNPFLPEIVGLIPLEEAIKEFPADRSILFNEFEKQKRLKDLALKSVQTLRFAIGPEGGWSDHERELFRQEGFESVQLAPYILRVDTAVVSAVSALYNTLF